MSTFNYTTGDEQPKQAAPYFIQFGPPQHQQPQQAPEDKFISQEMVLHAHNARMRNVYANARITEQNLILNGMNEIRMALNISSITVAEGDTGSKDRPPLDKAFDEDVRRKLQHCYLRMAERLVNHQEHFLVTELRCKLTNEIKLAPEGNNNEQSIS